MISQFLRSYSSWILLLILITPSGFSPLAQGTSADHDVWKALQTIERGIPTAEGHPGNIFLAGQEVIVKASPSIPVNATWWQILDDKRNRVRSGELKSEHTTDTFQAGALGVGWYRIEFLDAGSNCLSWTTAAVLAKLAAPVPQDSPICIDGAISWFAKENPTKQEQAARLAALTGANWIRDRIRWGEVQTGPSLLLERTTYDTAANLQSQFGLKILQVFHDTPDWAVEGASSRARFPNDLRVLYKFCKAMSVRYKNRVQAWEPWNEANAPDFGAQTVDEMCSMQKAAYLGFKEGDPTVTVGWNAYAGVPSPLHTKGVLKNEAWPYFDTYNIHTYDWPDSYQTLRKPVFDAACGRPIWVTESDRGIQYQTGEPWCDLSQESERLKAEFIAQSYACSLYAGCQRHFHFILGHYFGRHSQIQFGLLRLDFTPRPAYVALAAVGRFLAGARCVGRWPVPDNPDAHVYAFRAKPDGVDQDVLVAWAEKSVDWPQRGITEVEWSLPPNTQVQGVFDYLGRSLGASVPEKLKSAPVFILLPPNAAEKLPLERLDPRPFKEGKTSPVVLQLLMEPSTTVRVTEQPWAVEFEHQVNPGKEIDLPLFAYNFSNNTVHGVISVEHAPEGWKLTPNRWEVEIEPMGRIQLSTKFLMPARNSDKSSDNWINLRGVFGNAEESVLAFRLISFPGEGYNN